MDRCVPRRSAAAEGRRPRVRGREKGWISPRAALLRRMSFRTVSPWRRSWLRRSRAPEGARREVLGGATRDAARGARSGRCGGPARRARSRRRRGGVPARRRACDRVHGRLLPATRRRSADLRCHCRDERAQRRLRDGRRSAAGALGYRVSRGASPSRCSGRCSRVPTSGCAPPARSSREVTPFATTSRSTASRSWAWCILSGSGRRPVRARGTFSSSRNRWVRASSCRRSGMGFAPRRARGSGRVDDRAQPCRGRCHPFVRAQRSHRRHGVRPARTHVRARVAKRRTSGHRRGHSSVATQPSSSRRRQNGGDGRNREYAGPHVESHASAAWEALAYDPQTAGARVAAQRAGPVLEATLASQGLGRSHRASRGRLRSALPLVAVAVARARSVSARTFLRIALASCLALFLVITSGAFVRLTGSGRLRELAQLWRQALSGAGLSCVRRVRQPHGGARRIILTLATWLASWTTGPPAGGVGRSGPFSLRSRRSR